MRRFCVMVVSVLALVPVSGLAASCSGSGCAVSRMPILMYHHVRVDTNTKDRLGMSLSMTPKLFRDDLDMLKKNGYTTIRFTDLKNGATTVRKPVILTFDDGYDDAFSSVLPELKSRGMTAVFFIITGKLGTPGYLTVDELKQLKAAGMEIGGHTVTHPNLAILSSKKQREEITGSVSSIRAELGINVSSFAYPTGKYNATSVNLVKNAGVAYAVTTHHGIGDFKGNRLLLKRVRVTSTMDGKHLLMMLRDVARR